MSSDKEKIIKNFCKRFLDVEHEPDSFSDILNMNPNILKDCSDSDAEHLKTVGIKKIRHFLKKDEDDIEKISNKTGLEIHQLRKWKTAAGLVSRAWQKRSTYLKKESMKIAVLGLNNAGKTSMLQSLQGKTNVGEITDMQPTIGIDVTKVESDKFNMVIWDFGGQEGHRHDYLKNPEEYFLQIDLIFYVVDMQDQERFDEALKYFEQIIDNVTFLNENPYILILLHKCDPDLLEDPDFQINLEYIKEEILNILKKTKLFYELIETSIYNFYATEPEFAKTFKQFFAKKKDDLTLEDSIHALSETLMNMSTMIIENFNEIKALLGQENVILKPKDSRRSLPKNHLTSIPIPPSPPPSSQELKNETPTKSIGENRMDLMSELKSVLKLRRLMN